MRLNIIEQVKNIKKRVNILQLQRSIDFYYKRAYRKPTEHHPTSMSYRVYCFNKAERLATKLARATGWWASERSEYDEREYSSNDPRAKISLNKGRKNFGS